jgi:hypothetical protein
LSGVEARGVPEALAHLDKVAKAAASAAQKPVYVGTGLFYGRFQERGTRRGVRARRFLEQAAQTVKSSARRIVSAGLESGDVLAGLVELARKARTVAAGKAPTGRGKLRRSLKVQVGGRLRRE